MEHGEAEQNEIEWSGTKWNKTYFPFHYLRSVQNGMGYNLFFGRNNGL